MAHVPLGNLSSMLLRVAPIKLNGPPDYSCLDSFLWSVIDALSEMNMHLF